MVNVLLDFSEQFRCSRQPEDSAGPDDQSFTGTKSIDANPEAPTMLSDTSPHRRNSFLGSSERLALAAKRLP